MPDCLTDDTLALLVERSLSDDELRSVHEHVDTCEACRLLLAEAVKGVSLAPAAAAAASAPAGASPLPDVWPQTAQDILAKYAHIGAYRIQRIIGEGGMGVVFAAVHVSIGRRVAIKVLHRRLSADPEFRARFFNEARAVNIIQHPGIVGVFEFGELPDGGLYLVMEYLEGRPLSSNWPLSAAPLERATELDLLRQVATALQAAHEKGIVHRDLKPENVMVIPDRESAGGQRIKVLDFGLAKLERGPLQMRTRSDAMMGTPLYMSPEQCRGAGEVDAKTDVYALGVMLYEALTAHPPFQATSPGELLAMHLYQEPPRPQRRARSIPSALDALVVDMLAKRSSARPTMTEVADRLAVLISDLRSRSAGPPPPAWRAYPAVRRAALLLGGVAAGLAAAHYFARSPSGPIASRRAPAPTPAPPAPQADAAAAVPAPASPPPAPAGMAYLPGGTFTMGSTQEEADAAYEFCRRLLGDPCQRDFYQRELPTRRITLSPFYLDTTEVTNAQFSAWLNQQPGLRVDNDRLIKDGPQLLADVYPAYGYSGLRYEPADAPADDPGSDPRADAAAPAPASDRFSARLGLENKPVVQVSWFAAERYCRARQARLPTEAEWEFAARGPHGYRFPWGDNEPSCEGVVFGRLRGEACANAGAGPMDVGRATQDRSPFGIHDLGGNVSEWVLDVLQAPYPACRPRCRDPINLSPGDAETPAALHVVRGGNWFLSAESCRGAGRSRLPGDQLKGNIGFRCARPLNPTNPS